MAPVDSSSSTGDYRSLDPDRIVATIARLRDRIRDRFPSAGLLGVANTLLTVAKDLARRSIEIRKPILILRAASVVLLAAIAVAIIGGIMLVQPHLEAGWRWLDVIQTLEATLGTLFFLTTGVVLLVTLEIRKKRRRALDAIHEMRAMAHIVDMHQLTKDPERLERHGPDTPSSPKHAMTPFELVRYLDYCSEMLSLIGKIAAAYVQGLWDPAANSAVDEVEALTTALSSKIWQKIMILEQRAGVPHDKAVAGQDS